MTRLHALAPLGALIIAGCAATPRAPAPGPAGTTFENVSAVNPGPIAPAALGSTLVPASPSSAGMSDALPARLDSIVRAAIADRATPGAVVAVGRRGRLVLLRGWGRHDWDPASPPATDSSMYDMASLTKVVATTTAAMLLEERGQLDLDRTVASDLPEYAAPDKAAITVRMLLTHRSGIRSYHNLYREVRAKEEYLRRMAAHPLAFRPGERSEYTDWNLILLQEIVERITGEGLDAYVATRVFQPLGMRDTRFTPDSSLRPRIAPTEVTQLRGHVWGEVHDENAWRRGGVSGHAGLFSSARDLAVFAQMLLNGGEYGGRRLLRPETIARWTARQQKDASRALGWDTPSPGSSAGRYLSARSFGHTGFTGTSIWIDPEQQLFVVLLTNRVNPTRDNGKVGPLRRAVADAVRGSVVDAPLRVLEPDTTARR